MTWKHPWDYPLPDFATNPAEYMLAYDVRSNLQNASLNFLRVDPDPQFANPQAYLMNMVREAVGLTQNNFAVKYAPPGWDAVKAGFDAAYSCFDFLKQLPVNAGDEKTVSIYDAWVAKTGQLYGGHPVAPLANSGVSAGPETVAPGTIFGGTKAG